MLTVHQPKVFSRNLVLYDGNSSVAEVRYRSFTEAAEIAIGGDRYIATRSGWFRSEYTLTLGDSQVAQAEGEGFWQRAYRIRAASSSYLLKRQPGWFQTGWLLLEDERSLGTLERRGFFQTETVVTFSTGVPLHLRAFIIWMANVIWRQDQSATAAAAAAG